MSTLKDARIVFLVSGFTASRSSTRFNRASLLTENFDTVIVTARDSAREIIPGAKAYFTIKANLLRPFLIFGLLTYLKFIHKFNVIHCEYGISSIPVGFSAKYFLRYKWVWDLWDHPLLPIDNNKGKISTTFKRLLYDAFLCKLLKGVDLVLVSMQKNVLDTLPSFRPVTIIIYLTNGYNSEIIKKVNKEKTVILKTSPELQICYSGSINMRRGLPLLIDYLNKRKNKIPLSIKLFGRITDTAKKEIENFNAKSSEKINYIGKLEYENNLRIVRNSDICLCLLDQSVLSYRYSYPIKLFEYLALGKIIIATNTIATREIIIPGKNGFLIENTVKDLEKTLNEIESLRVSGELTRISDKAAESVKNYNWVNINKKLNTSLKVIFRRDFKFN